MNPETTIAIISDIHIGVHRSSQKFLATDIAYAKWLKAQMDDRGVETLYILGDVFNDRRDVSLPALETAREFFDEFKDKKVTVLCGNHDAYLDDSSEINSLALLTRWPNITVVSKPVIGTYQHDNRYARYAMLPWGYYPSGLGDQRLEVLFGHFEINTFSMTAGQICEHGIGISDIESVCDKCFSGHFHLRSHRDRGNGKFISYVGSPFELNWGDYGGLPKAVCYYDWLSGEVEFVENTVSPRYVKIDVSDLSTPEQMRTVANKISGNMVRIISDGSTEFKPATITKMVQMVNELQPYDLQCDIKATENKNQLTVDTNSVTSLDVDTALVQYIDAIDNPLKDEASAIVKRMYASLKR